MYKLRLCYSPESTGDGGAGVTFVDSEKLASFLQDNDLADEGWADDCSGYIDIESESPITCSKMKSIDDVIEMYIEWEADEDKIDSLKKLKIELE